MNYLEQRICKEVDEFRATNGYNPALIVIDDDLYKDLSKHLGRDFNRFYDIVIERYNFDRSNSHRTRVSTLYISKQSERIIQ